MTEKKNTWVRKRFKGKKVWVATDPEGELLEKNGKVLVKYQLNQNYEYWVLIRNIQNPEDSDDERWKEEEKAKQTRFFAESDEPVPENAIRIHTDGASSGNPGPAGIGVVFRFGGHEKEISKYIGEASNNIAELMAIETGLTMLKRKSLPVRIFTDSQYAVGMLCKNWKIKKNAELINAIREKMKTFSDLKLIKIKGHAGDKYNERADYLATSAIRKKDPGKK